jgi:hypothetical protein
MHAHFVEMLMARSNDERFIMGARMFDAARQMLLASAPEDLSGADLKAWLYERTYGEPLPARAKAKLIAAEQSQTAAPPPRLAANPHAT